MAEPAADPLPGGLRGFAQQLVADRGQPASDENSRSLEPGKDCQIGVAGAEIPRDAGCLQAATTQAGPPWPEPSPSAVAVCLQLLRAGATAQDVGPYWRIQLGTTCMLAQARTVAAARARLGRG